MKRFILLCLLPVCLLTPAFADVIGPPAISPTSFLWAALAVIAAILLYVLIRFFRARR